MHNIRMVIKWYGYRKDQRVGTMQTTGVRCPTSNRETEVEPQTGARVHVREGEREREREIN